MRVLAIAVFAASACAVPGDKMAWHYDPRLQPVQTTLRQVPDAVAPMAIPSERVYAELEFEELPAPSMRYHEGPLLLQWPLPATGINSLFGKRTDPFDGAERFHYGVDLDAPYGALVNASADGVVQFSGFYHGHGRQVIIEHAGGFRSGYSHLSQTLVFVGTRVTTNQPIGRVGQSGRSTGPHLHFEISRYGLPLDPLDLLGIPIEIGPASASRP